MAPDPHSDWKVAPATDLEAAISRFKRDLPGWWFSVCECQVSCDASCAPTVESEHSALMEQDDRFNSGFHADLKQPSTLAHALHAVRTEALEAITRLSTKEKES